MSHTGRSSDRGAADFSIPKRRIDVSVELAGGLHRDVTLFTAESASSHAGPERLSDVLNGTVQFVPALDSASGTMTFLNCASIVIARASSDLEPTEAEAMASSTEHAVEVALADGRTLHGTVSYVLPSERARLVDFLNERTPFLRLVVVGAILLINKRHVVRVAQVEL